MSKNNLPTVKKNSLTKKEELIRSLEELLDVFDGNEERENLKEFIAKVKGEKNLIPLVGIFSSGKSSLINAIIGTPVFTVSITPETALPAHISYSTEKSFIARSRKNNYFCNVDFDDIEDNRWVEKYIEATQANNNEASRTHLKGLSSKQLSGLYLDVKLPSENLMALSDITIVDMPGLDSSNHEHDTVANSYLGTSVGYIICISADEGTIRQSLLSLIKNISNKNILCGIVITKADKHEASKISAVKEQAKKEFLGVTGIEPAFVVSVSARKRDIGSFLDKLKILNKKYAEQFKKNELTNFYKKTVNYNNTLANRLKAVKTEATDTKKLIHSAQQNIAKHEEIVATNTDEFVGMLAKEFNEKLLNKIKKQESKLIELILSNHSSKERAQAFKKSIDKTINTVLDEIAQTLKEPEYNELYALLVKLAYQIGAHVSLPLNIDFNFDLSTTDNESNISKLTRKVQAHAKHTATARELIELNIKILNAEQERCMSENFNSEFHRATETLKLKLKSKVSSLKKELNEHSNYLEELEKNSISTLSVKRKKLRASLNSLKAFYGLNKTKKRLAIIGFGIFAMLTGLGAYLEYTEEEVNTKKQEVTLSSVVQPSKAAEQKSLPYIVPRLQFETSQLIHALNAEQVAFYWIEPIQSFLEEPEAYWEDCVYESARFSRSMGGLSEREAYDYGVSSCQGIVSNYYQCLNDLSLSSAVSCLKNIISDAEENGD